MSLLRVLISTQQQQPFYCQAPLATPSEDTQGMTLKFVQILIRHGDRTPLYRPPTGQFATWNCSLATFMNPSHNDVEAIPPASRQFRKVYLPGRNFFPGNCSLGQLTDLGFAQHSQLGTTFRQLYVQKYGLLSEHLNLSEVWVRSTDVYRTVQSAQSELTALYPPPPNAASMIDVIDIHTMDDYHENMSPNTVLCPALNTLYNNLTSLPVYQQFIQQNAQLQQTIMSTLGEPNFPGWSSFMDYFFALQCHGFPLPDGITDDLVQQVYEASFFTESYPFGSESYSRLAMSSFLQEVVQNIENFLSGASPLKYVLFSGHDDSVGPFVNLFGLYKIWPAYASHVEMEIWQDNTGDYYLQFKYNGESYTLPTCNGVMCPIQTFLDLSYSLMVPDYIDDEVINESRPTDGKLRV
ncbi:component of the counting factor complex [Heterostelium album PN500]|uniref:Component of the counting factor complex n=1 Tax=Heterostelium pallidum (strain ATCC 26659 / Pp 5 / PN500) TaxID=670386 RepID=D3B3S3_HETP5|nr:component of the counting factor complex [Heterostelium album PN500]EFA83971.1 component of the counting factor complex [Heterostelium album PN500]|eukprot:XP_020436088.1 component of the counting factor complex [Heterostelium album PN500]